jgi:hypothetical protein
MRDCRERERAAGQKENNREHNEGKGRAQRARQNKITRDKHTKGIKRAGIEELSEGKGGKKETMEIASGASRKATALLASDKHNLKREEKEGKESKHKEEGGE